MTKKVAKRKNSDVAVIVFAKNPRLGKVKTRLAQGVGDDMALAIYRELLHHTREVVSDLNVSSYLYYDDHIADDDWSDEIFNKRVQCQGNLGLRMKTAFAEVCIQHKHVLIVGSDCPQLSSFHIEDAVSHLESHDVVIGPTFDGGYYLLGMKDVHEPLFDDIPWSTEEVFQITIDRARFLSLSVGLLPRLSDIDYKEDWDQYGWELTPKV